MSDFDIKFQARFIFSVFVAAVLAIGSLMIMPDGWKGDTVWGAFAIGALLGMFFHKWNLSDSMWPAIFALFFGPIAFFTVNVTYPLFCKFWKLKRDNG